MPGKIFVNYRRDDDPSAAARVRDGLAAKFGKTSVFMDVDNLLAGQRFDEELAKALVQCDVLIAVIGPRWIDLLKTRAASAERDYVREEIAEALKRKIVVIPVRVGREGQLTALPRQQDLPEDIRDLVLYQKHDVAYERFGRDIAELVEAITVVRRTNRPQLAAPRVPWGWVGATAASVLVIGYTGAYYAGMPVPWLGAPSGQETAARAGAVAAEQKRLADLAAEVKREQEARAKAEGEAKRQTELAAQARLDLEARQKAEAEAATKRKADEDARVRAAAETERVRLAALKAEEDRQRAAAEAKRRADEEAARRVPQPGQTFRDCPDGCPEMVVLPSGSFTMGSPSSEEGRSADEGPQRTVTIRQPFAVGKFEVTFAEWEACVANGGCTSNRSPSDQGWGKGRRPVINVSWNDAKEYVAWLSRKTGKAYRLLSEAEWEYAARAGSMTRYSWGNSESDLCGFANGADLAAKEKNSSWTVASCRDGYVNTAPVGSFKPNAFGLHDMHGNVWEWCEDTWHSNYQGAPNDGSAWTSGGTSSRVLRGGSWSLNPFFLRSAYRVSNAPDYRNFVIGFRVARTL